MTAAPGAGRPLGSDAAGLLHRAAVSVGVAGAFRGSGFFAGEGTVVTAAHVVAGASAPVVVTWPDGSYEVAPAGVRAHPEHGDGGRFFPFPDLAVLSGPRWGAHPVARLAAADPAPGTEVTALGYSTHTPTNGVQPDTLVLRVGGRSGDFVRVLGDGVRDGLSGSMLVDADGLVVGVLKGSRSYVDAQGGWFTPVSAVHALLGTAAPPPVSSAPAPPPLAPPSPAPPPTDSELVDALTAFPALARAEARHDLLHRMGDLLGLPYSFEVEERPARRDHLFRLILACRHFRDARAALTALCTAMTEIAPHDKALEPLRDLVGRAVTGGWGG
ncbi:trypsin-like peptidase domain-containing protein [Streptomyces sp.]|uniref:trypsin-like peptidase domain-containing protein n=1 Tax=Streptomyces sp. TaxID=1931 RepID=UPI002F40C928